VIMVNLRHHCLGPIAAFPGGALPRPRSANKPRFAAVSHRQRLVRRHATGDRNGRLAATAATSLSGLVIRRVAVMSLILATSSCARRVRAISAPTSTRRYISPAHRTRPRRRVFSFFQGQNAPPREVGRAAEGPAWKRVRLRSGVRGFRIPLSPPIFCTQTRGYSTGPSLPFFAIIQTGRRRARPPARGKPVEGPRSRRRLRAPPPHRAAKHAENAVISPRPDH